MSRSSYVDYRSALHFVGSLLLLLVVPLAVPVILAVLYGESPVPFLATMAVAGGLGFVLRRLGPDPDLGHREGFLVVALSWLAVPLVGTLPYLIAGEGTLAAFPNALFESMSGFTTTGATVMGEISVERHGRAMMLWRQLTQWLGGMGIVVLMVAILPDLSVGGAQLIREESPGLDVDKLTPRIRETAAALWKIYAALTVLAALVYYALHLAGLAPNMGLYNAVAHALTTLPTGGFSPEARSVEAFSPVIQWAVVPFMMIAGTNFALFWYVLQGRPRRLVENTEFRWYAASMAVVTALIAAMLYVGVGLDESPDAIAAIAGNAENALRQAVFQTVAIVTTTGYASMDFNAWSDLAKVTLFFAMFLGGSAGSAAGSVKIIRWVAISKAGQRELFTTIHPDAVRPIRFRDKVIDEDTVRGVFAFVLIFLGIFAVSTVLLYLDAQRVDEFSLNALEAASVALATLGNIGPGFGEVGPMGSYERFTPATKFYLVFLMWIGRLEIISVLVVLTPGYWRS
ncbi:TrkH family potassium uptake protein [Halomicrobium salinisoli]|uniref:TrkH family potassium uptake protein n=1 Tax=Halomicrobium salinisoli TaxID=2878391 RepID=UPI001CF06D03|nr:TrkH family potassium uptake protein [Halomicrobium salinisoli]